MAVIADSQCGDRFAFDVELLYLARLAGFRIRDAGLMCVTAARTAATRPSQDCASVGSARRVAASFMTRLCAVPA